MAYPTSDWPTSIDAAKIRVDDEIIPATDFNYQDEQIRAIQSLLGANADLIGDDGVAAHGPGGLLSPVASGSTAIQLAARADYATGKLLSVGDNFDTAYDEKLFMAASGVLDVSGVTDYETLVTGDDHIPNKKYVDDEIDAISALLSPIVDGGTAITLAARADYTSGKILSIGDNYDTAYAEKFFIAASGVLDVSGVTDYETLVVDDDHIPNKKWVSDTITASIPASYWTKSGTVVEVLTSGDTIEVGDGSISQPGYRFNSDSNTGIFTSGAGHVNFTLNGSEGLDITKQTMWKMGSLEQQLFLFRDDDPGDGADIAEIRFTSRDVALDTIRYASIQGYIIDESNPQRAGGLRIFVQNVETVPIVDIYKDKTNHQIAMFDLKRCDDHADNVDLAQIGFWGTMADGITPGKYAEIAGICDTDGSGEAASDGSLALRVDSPDGMRDRLRVNGDSSKGCVSFLMYQSDVSVHSYRQNTTGIGTSVYTQKFFGTDGSANEEQYAEMRVIAVDISASDPDGRIDLRTDVAGTITDQISIGPGLSVGPTGTVLPPGAGAVNVSSHYEVDDVQVLTNRITGWTAPSGTADRTGYNADGPPTLTEVAQALKGLIDDLFTHGIIGT